MWHEAMFPGVVDIRSAPVDTRPAPADMEKNVTPAPNLVTIPPGDNREEEKTSGSL